MSLGYWLTGVASAVAGVAVLVNIPARYILPTTKATLGYLKSGLLETTTGAAAKFPEASELSSLLPELKSHDIRLCAVVHEKRGVEEFRKFFKGDIFFDEKRHFYGPEERFMNIWGLFRINFFKNMMRNREKSIDGNMKGEGRIFGGVFVIAPGDDGILLQHQEMEFGDIVKNDDVLAAVKKMKSSL